MARAAVDFGMISSEDGDAFEIEVAGDEDGGGGGGGGGSSRAYVMALQHTKRGRGVDAFWYADVGIAVYEKNAARMRALGVAPETAPETSTNADPDQLEGLLRNFLKANQGESGGVSAFDAGEPPSVERGEFDHPALGLNVEGAEDEDFGLGRPNTQMSMQAETRFVGSQY